ncbi:MAG: hypothetical protein ACREFI_17495 [Stellaceae bacterium]
MDRAHRRPPQGDGDRGGRGFTAGRDTRAHRKPANDNRLGLRGWIERLAALALLIGLAALLAWKLAG